MDQLGDREASQLAFAADFGGSSLNRVDQGGCTTVEWTSWWLLFELLLVGSVAAAFISTLKEAFVKSLAARADAASSQSSLSLPLLKEHVFVKRPSFDLQARRNELRERREKSKSYFTTTTVPVPAKQPRERTGQRVFVCGGPGNMVHEHWMPPGGVSAKAVHRETKHEDDQAPKANKVKRVFTCGPDAFVIDPHQRTPPSNSKPVTRKAIC